MVARRTRAAKGALLACCMAGIVAATDDVGNSRGCLSVGPDVVTRFWDSYNFGSVGDVAAFAFGNDACNIGDQNLDWVGDTPDHPVINSALYRIKNGRFEQVGLSWGKHGFAAAQDDRCGCGCIPSGDNQHLGVGCADAYSATVNGVQGYMGPRSEINPFTGVFPFPPSGWGQTGDAVFRRLQVHHADLQPSVPGVVDYIGEIQLISAHDSLYGNQFNNSTWQPVNMGGSVSDWNLTISGDDHVGEPALRAWAASHPSVRITDSRPPDDGLILVGCLVSPVSDGWYQYEYAIQNVNAHRGVRAIEIPLPLGGEVIGIGFHDVDYHSGEMVDGTDWATTLTPGEPLRWSTESFSESPAANAIRWGTTYNVRFTSNVPPADGAVVVRPFRDGYAEEERISMRVPSSDVDPCLLAQSPCPSDLVDDGVVDIADLLLLFDWWGDCGDGTYRPPADATGDCCVDIADVLAVIDSWGQECGPSGACCLTDGSCTMEGSEDDCLLAGGTWNGSFVSCSDVNCSNIGACCYPSGTCEETTYASCTLSGGFWNGTTSSCLDITCGVGADDCEDAAFVQDGLHFVDTTNATTDGPAHEKCRTGGDGGTTANDKWLRYTATGNGQLTVSTCEEVGGSADYDTDLVVYSGIDCVDPVLLGCNDDDPDHPCGTEPGGYHSTVTVPVTGGSNYLIRIGGWQESSTGTSWLLIDLE